MPLVAYIRLTHRARRPAKVHPWSGTVIDRLLALCCLGQTVAAAVVHSGGHRRSRPLASHRHTSACSHTRRHAQATDCQKLRRQMMKLPWISTGTERTIPSGPATHRRFGRSRRKNWRLARSSRPCSHVECTRRSHSISTRGTHTHRLARKSPAQAKQRHRSNRHAGVRQSVRGSPRTRTLPCFQTRWAPCHAHSTGPGPCHQPDTEPWCAAGAPTAWHSPAGPARSRTRRTWLRRQGWLPFRSLRAQVATQRLSPTAITAKDWSRYDCTGKG